MYVCVFPTQEILMGWDTWVPEWLLCFAQTLRLRTEWTAHWVMVDKGGPSIPFVFCCFLKLQKPLSL